MVTLSRTYYFEFSGTRQQFLDTLNQYPNNDHKFFYFEDYIVEKSDNIFCFGVQRGGHAGGYWFKPTIEETDNKLLFSGEIEYSDYHTNERGSKKVINKIEEGCLVVILLPVFIIFKLYTLIKTFLKKTKKQPIENTLEDRLFYLMENLLNCTRK